jgi:hypothetical protein
LATPYAAIAMAIAALVIAAVALRHRRVADSSNPA